MSLLILSIVLICCAGTVCAADSNNTVDIVSDVDSNEEYISVSDNEQADNVDESVLSAQDGNLSTNNVLKEDEFGNEDGLDDEEYELDNNEINEYLNDIKLSTSEEYFNFVKYLLNTNKFIFKENSPVNGGYKIFATENYQMKLYDGNIYRNSFYFVSTGSSRDLYVEGFYPNTFHYDENGNVVFDKLYYTWQNSQMSKYIDYTYTGETGGSGGKYDLRDYGYVTSVKNQGTEGNCWAFASIGALESFLVKNEGKTYDFSENNLKNVMSSLGSMGTDKAVNSGGGIRMSIAYFLRWSGPIMEKDDRYVSNNLIETLKPVKHVQGIKYIFNRTNSLDNDAIKNAIKNYGAVVTSIYWDNIYVKEETSSYYNPSAKNHNHEICIVGWNDTYSRNNFLAVPPGDGAFIIKNSWGDGVGDKGYYYVSYYDPTIAIDNKNTIVSYVFTDVEDTTNYGFNYQYTPLGFTDFSEVNSKDVKFYNQWTAHKDDTLEACGFYNFIPSECEIKVYIDGKSQGTTNHSLNDPGFYTINFNQPVNVKKGQKFKIEITLTSVKSNHNYVALEKKFNGYSKVNANPGESFIYINNEWKDMSKEGSSNICLNVYTKYFDLKETKIFANNLDMNYGENKFLDIRLMDIDGNPIKNAELILSIDNNERKLITDNNGKASLSLKDFSASQLDININYWGDKNYDFSQKKVTINIRKIPTIIVCNPFTYNDRYVKIYLKNSITGEALANKKIDITVGKNVYSATTNNGGRAELKASKTVFTGNSKINVQFGGDTNYDPFGISTNIKTLVVSKIEGIKSKYKTDDKVKMKLDKKIKLKLKVSVNINKKTRTASFKTNENGKASIKLYKMFKKYRLETKKEHKFKIWYENDDNCKIEKPMYYNILFK